MPKAEPKQKPKQKPKPKSKPARAARLSLSLESKTESADRAELRVIEFAGNAGCDEWQCHEIGLAVREAVANAVLHGNRHDAKKKVLLKAEMGKDELHISIRDEGEGFDPDDLPNPLQDNGLLRESGRGVFLVKACMDEVAVRRVASGGTEVILRKHISSTPARRKTK